LTKEAALEFMKQNKSNDLEVSDLPTEDVKVDGIPFTCDWYFDIVAHYAF
jgi:hypothetical protein